MMRKTFERSIVSDAADPDVPATSGSGPAEDTPPFSEGILVLAEEIQRVIVLRPGGLIGALPGDADPGSNWHLFLNA